MRGMIVKIQILHQRDCYTPILCGEARYYSFSRGAPGRLECEALDDGYLPLAPGDEIFAYDAGGELFFAGYLFTWKRTDRDRVALLAYDALRYFKNKDTLVYENLTASGLLQRICNQYQLKTGNLAQTPYLIGRRVEHGVTLFDIVENALDETFRGCGKRYILHCDNGRICLSDRETFESGVCIRAGEVTRAQISTSIDRDVYTRVRLTQYNPSLSQYETSTASSDKISEWGVLQYHGTVDRTVCAPRAARNILQAAQRPVFRASIACAVGDLRVLGGKRISLDFTLGSEKLAGKYTVSSCTHLFSEFGHTMQLVCRKQ